MRSNQEGQNFYQQERVQFVTFHRLKSELYKYYNIYFNKVFYWLCQSPRVISNVGDSLHKTL